MFIVLATLFALTEVVVGLSCPLWVSHRLLPHPDTCNKFLSCSYGVTTEMNCPGGLEYNMFAKQCLWPHESWCVRRPRSAVEAVNLVEPIPAAVPVVPEVPVLTDDNTEVRTCRVGPFGRFLQSYPGDCSKFIYCINGEATVKDCPEGTHFNSKFMVCQDPFFAGCQKSLIIKPEDSNLICPRFPSSILLPHPDTCSQFYICDYGVPHVFDCPAGLHYSVLKKSCVWPSESRCFRLGDLVSNAEN